MRLYVPLTPAMLAELAENPTALAGSDQDHRVPRPASAGSGADGAEAAELEAMLEAAEDARAVADPGARFAVAALEAARPTGEPPVPADATLVSVHVSEADARTAGASDTEPDLLWFDVSELASASDYLRGGELG